MDSMKDIIYPEIEPGVISKEMIEKSYSEDGYKGEALRLHQMEPIRYEKITVLRLEFLNILRIDHLWMMPNLTKLGLNCNKIEVIENIGMLTSLKELNLSFNYIEKIENLHTLKNLEVLSLYNNLITVIEGFDALENLVIFSLGNNKIESLKGLERMRFLKKLSVLNMEGNPVCQMLGYSLSTYIAALLPNVKYYEYSYIEDSVREAGKQKFIRELREIEAAEEEEIEIRNHKAKELEGEQRFSSSFVEYLNEHQLFESLWLADDDGRTLIQIGGDNIDDLMAEYRSDIFAITQEIFKLGLEKFEERKKEIDLYMKSVEEGQLKIQKSGHKTIDEYVVIKDEVFKEATNCLRQLETRSLQGEDDDSPESVRLFEQFENISLNFQEKTNDIWQILMDDELHLYESIMESTSFFERNIQEMMSKFVEQTQIYFAQIRDVAVHFSENLTELVQQYIGEKLATRMFNDVPDGLKICLEDKDALNNLIVGMKDHHVQKIDEREDRLVVRSKQFVTDLIEQLQKNELERNRAKILEINSYIEQMTNNIQSLQGEIREELLNKNI
ncbi:dynein regulatory complex subunit 3 [Episyrphus balteatus]|uniref:dynein regulatory complex subunit 3 n=1 Tax=Episyrphus balteatus TaxID=286459 RepID=UPI002485F711|nr:dynein regulatory complex subunit 3 [Episyrphus balteatus]